MFRRPKPLALEKIRAHSALNQTFYRLGTILVRQEAFFELGDVHLLHLLIQHRRLDEPYEDQGAAWSSHELTTPQWDSNKKYLVVTDFYQGWTYVTVVEDAAQFEEYPLPYPRRPIVWQEAVKFEYPLPRLHR